MELRLIRYFVALAEAETFTRAAERAFVAQPTLSAGIAKLEAELGVALFERGARRTRLTPDGTRFLPHAKAILRQVQAARADLAEPRRGRPLRVGALTTVPSALVARALAALDAATPDRTSRYRAGTMAQIDDWLATGHVDLALTVVAADTPAPHRRPWFTDRQALALPVGHGIAPVRPDVLHQRPLVVRTHCEALLPASRILDRTRTRPRVVLRTDNDALALELVAAGRGACLMPDSFAHPSVVLEPVEGVDLPRTVGFAWSDEALGPPVEEAGAALESGAGTADTASPRTSR